MTQYGRNIQDAIAEQLRAERAIQDLTLDELSERSGVPKGTLFRYLKGQRDIPMSALGSIAEGLGLHAVDIVRRAEARMEDGH